MHTRQNTYNHPKKYNTIPSAAEIPSKKWAKSSSALKYVHLRCFFKYCILCDPILIDVRNFVINLFLCFTRLLSSLFFCSGTVGARCLGGGNGFPRAPIPRFGDAPRFLFDECCGLGNPSDLVAVFGFVAIFVIPIILDGGFGARCVGGVFESDFDRDECDCEND